MEYIEIESKLKQENQDEILDNFENTFNKLSEYSTMLTEGVYDTDGDMVSELISRCTGYWDQLKVVYDVIDAYKDGVERSNYQKKKIIAGENNERFNSSATKEECLALTTNLRRVRNIIGAYMSVADKNISMCMSKLKYLTEGKQRSGLQEV